MLRWFESVRVCCQFPRWRFCARVNTKFEVGFGSLMQVACIGVAAWSAHCALCVVAQKGMMDKCARCALAFCLVTHFCALLAGTQNIVIWLQRWLGGTMMGSLQQRHFNVIVPMRGSLPPIAGLGLHWDHARIASLQKRAMQWKMPLENALVCGFVFLCGVCGSIPSSLTHWQASLKCLIFS